VVIFVFLAALFCAVIAIWPRVTWMGMSSWAFKDPQSAELTDGMDVARSLVAGAVAVGLVALGVWALVTEDERTCRTTMAQLAAEARDDVGELGGDVELIELASQLDVDLVEPDEGGDDGEHMVVDVEGRVLGTIDDDGDAHTDCV
jgi:hypothetical protein